MVTVKMKNGAEARVESGIFTIHIRATVKNLISTAVVVTQTGFKLTMNAQSDVCAKCR